ncbi:hypothetical protein [Bacillus sp. 1P06AnD]|uniref:hypothetical protein n=1 Tax=Bacillus sp. 1P06AnD TaxID=3132208 RepID=UPI0039A1A2A4
MFKKTILSLTILLFLLLGISTIFTLHNVHATTKQLENYTHALLGEQLRSLLSFEDCEIQGQEIIIKTKLHENFSQLDVKSRYGYLSFYAKHLRYSLRNQSTYNVTQYFDIKIIGSYNNTIYVLHNYVPDKKVKVKSKSSLFINDALVYNSTQYKKDINRYRSNNRDFIDHDEQILSYAINLFNTITTNGKYYNHKKDAKIILDMVTDKFQITPEEYEKIYLKYFFLTE